jgi:hypothetical protein
MGVGARVVTLSKNIKVSRNSFFGLCIHAWGVRAAKDVLSNSFMKQFLLLVLACAYRHECATRVILRKNIKCFTKQFLLFVLACACGHAWGTRVISLNKNIYVSRKSFCCCMACAYIHEWIFGCIVSNMNRRRASVVLSKIFEVSRNSFVLSRIFITTLSQQLQNRAAEKV